MPVTDLEALAEVMRTLGHDTRLRLIAALLEHGETSVSEIEGLTGIGQPGLSQQLAILRKAELVQTRRAAKQVYYCISPQAFKPAARFLATLAPAEASSNPAPPAPMAPPTRGSAAMFAKML